VPFMEGPRFRTKGLDLGPTFYVDEIFLVNAHMYTGPEH
jgi:hypothetical protein